MYQISNYKKKHFFIFLISIIFIIFWLYPLWYTKDLAIIEDGNRYLQRIEAFKITIFEYKQFPQNNPWVRGGSPLSILLMSPLSIKFWLFMTLETKSALSFYMLFSFVVLFYGSYKVASFYFRNRIFRYFFAFLSIFNIALIFHLKAGHFIFLSFCYFPIIFYFLFKHRTIKYSGVFSGYLFGLMLDDDMAYMTAYCILILGIFIIYFLINSKKRNRKKIYYWIFFFCLTSLSVIAYKLNIFIEIQQEFGRKVNIVHFVNIFSFLKSYLIPYYELKGSVFPGQRFCESTWENSVYVGVIAFIFIFYAFKNKFNSVHFIILFLFLLQLGTLPYLPYGLLKNLPVFESHLCFNRIRTYNSFYLSILIITGFIYISKHKDNKLYKIRNYLLIFVLIERLLTSHFLMYGTHKNYKDVHTFSKNSVSMQYKDFNILEKYKDNKKFFNYTILPSYEATKQNIGVMRTGGDSFLSYSTYGKNYIGAYAMGEIEYKGEFTIDEKIIEPEFWSPNVIIFNNLDINKKLQLNMNPNRGWKLNGQELFRNHKIWEPNKQFVINITEPSIKLTYEAPGKKRGIIINLLVFFILLISVYKFKNIKL